MSVMHATSGKRYAITCLTGAIQPGREVQAMREEMMAFRLNLYIITLGATNWRVFATCHEAAEAKVRAFLAA